ncbi:AAA family ATPase [Dictyobacter kobayashii]|uniref:MalT-like winged helix domain-containing protein n=1 Tax=Dictyobacter kobayashii TaxID=2014872 RepID=A0A402AWV1_9CHLR|nr:AAA family ATPase [Dictyobacter kobayashii]GCE23620.1 hypothetical protein KDK_74200 [Dictyobacter kobayashii]
MRESDLLVTKFTVPPIRSELLARERLLDVLNQSCSHPLTLLSASAGFGKTTLLSAWATQRSSQVAWISLDPQDNDPTRFWMYVIAALRKVDLSVGAPAEAMLHASQPPLFLGALTSLVNELADLSHDIFLILDDYHLIREQALHDSLLFVLEHLPRNLHVLLSSRADPALPLARLRARRQVIEIREADLRLRNEEAASFLRQVMGLTLTEEEIGHLETRTEGWITGLQLAALSLRRYTDVSAFLQTFTGSHRFILDYVQSEILEPLPEKQQRFLLYASVLTRLNAEICQILTGEPASQRMLEDLERANLFLLPLDEERRWYRFHALFREVLLARLQATQPEQITLLHREAALWYQRQGWLHEAIPMPWRRASIPLWQRCWRNVLNAFHCKGSYKHCSPGSSRYQWRCCMRILAWPRPICWSSIYFSPFLNRSKRNGCISVSSRKAWRYCSSVRLSQKPKGTSCASG